MCHFLIIAYLYLSVAFKLKDMKSEGVASVPESQDDVWTSILSLPNAYFSFHFHFFLREKVGQ